MGLSMLRTSIILHTSGSSASYLNKASYTFDFAGEELSYFLKQEGLFLLFQLDGTVPVDGAFWALFFFIFSFLSA